MKIDKAQFVADIMTRLWIQREEKKIREIERRCAYYDYSQDRWTKTLRKRNRV